MKTLLYFDGLCEPFYEGGPRNPGGLACYGWLIKRNGETITSDCGCLGHGPNLTNNVAEYTALIAGLEFLLEQQLVGPVEIYGDSQLVLNQIDGVYQCRSQRLWPYYERALELTNALDAKVGSVTLSWIPREQNTEADGLTRQAFDQALSQIKPPF